MKFLWACSIAALVVCGSAAKAELILQPVSTSTNMGTFGTGHAASNAINQGGLSASYTSQVTDFDTYLAGNPTHNTINNDWISSVGALTGHFDFDLGGSFVIQSMALWNLGGNNGSNLRSFNLLASNDAS